MSDVSIFKFEESFTVRTVIKDNEPWFVAKDVCDVLGLTNSRVAVSPLDEDEKGVSKVYTPSGEQEMCVINESGLYALVIRSNKPNARKFRKWITSEVLPAIRKTGRYAVPVQPELPLSAPYFIPETTYYGVPVMSTMALAKRLGVTIYQIHNAVRFSGAAFSDCTDLYRVKSAKELRAGGCGLAWGRLTNHVNLFTESGVKKVCDYLRGASPALPVLPASSVRPEVLPPVKAELPKPALDLPRLTRSRGAVTITGAEFRSKLGDCNLDVEKLLRKLSAAGYDVEREQAELAYLCATVNRCRRGAYEFMAQIETMNHHVRRLADMSYNTTCRFGRDGRIGVPETVTA